MTKWPEFVLFVATVILILITVLIYILDPENISTTAFTMSGIDIELWLLCVGTIAFLLVIMCFALSYRTWERKKAQIKDHVFLYLFYKKIDRYWVYLLITSSLIWILGLVVWAFTDSLDVLVICVFIPFIWAFGFTGYAYWVKNDYAVLMDIDAVNEKKKKIKVQEK